MNRARMNRSQMVAAVEKKVAEIKALGGGVGFESVLQRSATRLEQFFDDPGPPDDPVRVLRVTMVDFLGTKVTDADLRHLKGLTNLKRVGLNETQVTDAGLEHLSPLPNLRGLWLAKTNVTDEGLVFLKELTNLTYLNLGSTQVTKEGVKTLQQALPNCKIWH